MEITVKCPGCRSALPVAAKDRPSQIRCGRCGREIPLAFTDELATDHGVDRCPVCAGADFYSRKDFDPALGVLVVVIGAIISGIFYWYGLDLVAYGVLGSAVLIDFLVYRRLDEVTVCYRCHAECRGRYHRTAPAFDLHTADVLEHEYRRTVTRNEDRGALERQGRKASSSD